MLNIVVVYCLSKRIMRANFIYFWVFSLILPKAQQINVRPLVRTIIGKSQGVRTWFDNLANVDVLLKVRKFIDVRDFS